jgi:hypothetical protein
MTTSRTEIVIEGSNNGETWQAYEFKYKPGDVRRRLPWVAPYQPRALAYDYHFTDWSTRRKTGAVWTRTLRGDYFPVVGLKR